MLRKTSLTSQHGLAVSKFAMSVFLLFITYRCSRVTNYLERSLQLFLKASGCLTPDFYYEKLRAECFFSFLFFLSALSLAPGKVYCSPYPKWLLLICMPFSFTGYLLVFPPVHPCPRYITCLSETIEIF